jgi:hypothetical protein
MECAMAYLQLEELTSRKGEKILLFLTAENMAGVALTTLPVYVLTTSSPFLLRLLLLLGATAVGFVATWELGGLALYERVLWQLRGLLRRRMGGSQLTPEQLLGGRMAVDLTPPLRLDGPIEEVPRAALTTRNTPHIWHASDDHHAMVAQALRTSGRLDAVPVDMAAGSQLEVVEGNDVVL